MPLRFSQTPVPQWEKLARQLGRADGYAWIIPEWNGGANPSIKNMLLYADSQLLAHKPVMLVGISAGRGGFYPIMDTRSAGHKDTRYVISPEAIVINDCHNVFQTPELDEQAPDYALKLRTVYALSILKLYTEALKSLRQSKVIDHQTYPFGV